MRGLGYSVAMIPERDHETGKQEDRATENPLFAEGIDTARKILEDQLLMAIEWMKEPENQKKMFEAGVRIFKLVLMKKLPI